MEVPWVAWAWRTIRDLWNEISDDRVGDLAASISFFAILAMPASVLAMVTAMGSLSGLLGENLAADTEQVITDYVSSTFESQALTDTVAGLFEQDAAVVVGLVGPIDAARAPRAATAAIFEPPSSILVLSMFVRASAYKSRDYKAAAGRESAGRDCG